MHSLLPAAPTPTKAPIPVGTVVELAEGATLIDRDLLSGGSPWRLLRLSGASRAIVDRWRNGDVVQAGQERLARTLVQQGFLLPRYDRRFVIDDVDVIIPVFNDANALLGLLDQLEGFHVTVVDDGSFDRDHVADCVGRSGAKLIRLEDNAGPARARNVAALDSTREFLWFVDADVSLPDALDVARRLQADFADPLVAAAAPRVRGTEGPSRRDRFEEHFSPLDMGERSGLVVPGGPVGYVPGACLMVRRAAFGDGFDESLRVGEDVDFVWQLFDRGWLIRYDADVTVTHRARSSWRSWWRQRQRYGISSAELARRHGSRLAPLRTDTWTFIAWLSVLAGQPALGARIVRAARNDARDRFFAGEDDPGGVADEVVTRNMVRAGGPLARTAVRTFSLVLLLAALHPRLRIRMLALFVVGTAWRWRHRRPRLGELALGVADDLAYGVGVFQGSWRTRSLRPLTPVITRSSLRLREIVGWPSHGDEHRTRVADVTSEMAKRSKSTIERLSTT